jgi:hypothetical protein
MRVNNLAGLPPERFLEVERELAEHRSLKDVLDWSGSQPPGALLRQVISSVVIQDEYTHDVIVPWRDGLVLVYDTT